MDSYQLPLRIVDNPAKILLRIGKEEEPMESSMLFPSLDDVAPQSGFDHITPLNSWQFLRQLDLYDERRIVLERRYPFDVTNAPPILL